MATKTAPELDEFIALSQAKLGLSYDADDMKALRKKTARDLALNVARLHEMRDFDASASVAEVAIWAPEPERTSSGGNGARRPAAPKVSQAKLDYVASLLIQVWGEDEAAGLIADLGKYDGDHISRMIDSLIPLIPITDGQRGLLSNLIAQKLEPGSPLAVVLAGTIDELTKVEAKRHLDTLQMLPDYVAPAAPGEAPARRRNAPEVEADGMYRNPETGDIFKVQIAHHGSGKLYAKILVKLDEPTVVRGKEAHFTFVMARGAIMTIKPEWRLTREDAKEFGDLYGCCIRCGTVLTDEQSIARGMGDTCYGKME